MAEYELTGAGAVLLAAYLGIDKATLSTKFGPILARFPTVSSTDLWNAVRLLCEEDKSIAETAIATGMDVMAIELIQREL